MTTSLIDLVRDRAAGCCEYCQLPQAIAETPFQLDHVIAQQHAGPTDLNNLAWACFYCNKFKGPNIAGLDPQTGSLTRLFHPRNDAWEDHFSWAGPQLFGQTPVGRTTIVVLGINRPLIVTRRAALIAEGVFPPDRARRRPQ